MSQSYYEDAIPLLESGLKIAPQRADLQAALGESYFMSGKVDKAIEEFQKLIAIDPSPRSYVFMGLSYRNLGRFDEAKKYFQKGLELDPHSNSCLFNLGYIAERQGDTVEAEARFQESTPLESQLPGGASRTGQHPNHQQEALPEAAELLRKYVRVSRDPATGYYKLAMVERSLHDTTAADRDLRVFQTLSKNAAPGPYPYEHLI